VRDLKYACADCALEFLPYWHECLDEKSTLGGEMHQFVALYAACTDELPASESLLLYRDVNEMEESPECRINQGATDRGFRGFT
jgi:hypothetical protein